MDDLTLWRLRTAGRLVRGAAHDIRNPVGVLHGNLQFLRQVNASEGDRLQRLAEASGPYATPQELQGVTAQHLTQARLDHEDVQATLAECGEAIEQQLAAVEAVARIGREYADEQSGLHGLAEAVAEGVASAALFGRHIAKIEVDITDRRVQGRRSVWVLLVTVAVLDALERWGKGSDQHPMRVVEDGGRLEVLDDAPVGEEPPALAPICAALGVDYDWAPGRISVALAP